MAYKKYFTRDGKKFGPYYYESYRDSNGKVKTRYLGMKSPSEKKGKSYFIIGIFLMFLLSMGIFFTINPFSDSYSTPILGKSISNVTFSNLALDEKGKLNGIANISVQNETYFENSTLILSIGNQEVIFSINSSDKIFFPINFSELNMTFDEGSLKLKLKSGNKTFVSVTNFPNLSRDFSSNTSSREEIKRQKIVINENVRWIKKVNVTSEEIDRGNISIEIPREAKNVSVKTEGEIEEAEKEIENYGKTLNKKERRLDSSGITGRVSFDIEREGFFKNIINKIMFLTTGFSKDITGNVVLENELKSKGKLREKSNKKIIDVTDIVNNVSNSRKKSGGFSTFSTSSSDSGNVSEVVEVAVEYVTQGPKSKEENICRTLLSVPQNAECRGKRVTIYNNPEEEDLNYTDILSYTLINESLSQEYNNSFRVLWINNGNKSMNFETYDLNNNGWIDYIEWETPHLSNQTFGVFGDVPADIFTFQINTSLISGTEFSFQADNADLTVWWNSTDNTHHTGTGLISHTYSTDGIYNISLNGSASRISYYEETGDALIDMLTNISLSVSGINSSRDMFRRTVNFGTSSLTEPSFFDDVSGNVTDMNSMFEASPYEQSTPFNEDISNWNTSSVTDMYGMFSSSQFNQNISNWDVSSVTDMGSMFAGNSQYNQPLNNWNTSSVTNMGWMFSHASSFNQSLNNWDVSSVKDMQGMFRYSSFNQPLTNWNISNVTIFSDMFEYSPMNVTNYDNTLIGWNSTAGISGLSSNETIGVQGLEYCNSEAERQNIIDTYNWTFEGDSKNCTGIDTQEYFTFQINTSLIIGTEFSFQADNADLTVQWGDGNETQENGTGLISHTYSTDGIYNISLNGSASRISYYEGTEDALIDILTNVSSGVSGINSSVHMFDDTENFGNSSLTEPAFFDDVSGNITNMSHMFEDSQFNQNISNWDVSSVTDMSHMFKEVFEDSQFNQPLNNWNTMSVTNMKQMFYNSPFNQPLNNWNVSSVTDMGYMFYNTPFNQSLNNWDVSNVTNMRGMFWDSQFNQNISNWDTSSVTYMKRMFLNSQFNQNINNWNVSKVVNMYGMFASSSFNQSLNNWNVSSVIDMKYMFYNTPFNHPLNNWDVSSVTDMSYVFNSSLFNQDLGDWNVSGVTDFRYIFDNSSMNVTNYDDTLIGWNTLPTLSSSETIGVQGLEYCNSEAERQNIIDTYSWTFDGDSKNCTGVDNTAPSVNIVEPSEGQDFTSSTSSVSLLVTTNETATCNYTLNSGTTNNTLVSNLTGTGHSSSISVSSGNSYSVEIYCSDISGNSNNNESVTFSVQNPPSGGSGGGRDDSEDCVDECSLEEEENFCLEDSIVKSRTCGDYDSDSCSEWSDWNYVSCLEEEKCTQGECTLELEKGCYLNEKESKCKNNSFVLERRCLSSDLFNYWSDWDVLECPEGGSCIDGTCKKCNEEWVCTEWNSCNEGRKRRNCTDINSCGTDLEKPNETRKCIEGFKIDFFPEIDFSVVPKNYPMSFSTNVKDLSGDSSISVKWFSYSEKKLEKEEFEKGSLNSSFDFVFNNSHKIKAVVFVDGNNESKTWDVDINDNVSYKKPDLFNWFNGGSSCTPEWSCEWTECIRGEDNYSYAKNCLDLDNCGITLGKPQKKECSCYTEWECSDWGACEAEYNLESLFEGPTEVLGIRKKTCKDLNGCVSEKTKKEYCDLKIPIEIRETDRCGNEYTEIYDTGTGKTLSRVSGDYLEKIKNASIGKEKISFNSSNEELISKIESFSGRLDIQFVFGEFEKYCSYCYDGKKNYDETSVDCGPNCPTCKNKTDVFDWSWLVVIILLMLIIILIVLIYFVKKKDYFSYNEKEAFPEKKSKNKTSFLKTIFPVSKVKLRDMEKKKINLQIKEGNKMLEEGDIQGAKKIYQDISSLFSKLSYTNKKLYSKISKFYESIIKEEVNSLLKEGEKELEKGNVDRAKAIYQKIKNNYLSNNLRVDKSLKKIYRDLGDFYRKL